MLAQTLASNAFNKVAYKTQVYTRDDYAKHIKIIDKQGQFVHFTPNRIQADYLANRGKRNLVLKARQLGMSAGIQWDMTLDAITNTALQATLAHDTNTTARLRRLAKTYIDTIPEAMRPKRVLNNATTTTYAHTNSECVIATAGSLDIGVGFTYTRIHATEVARWRDASAIVSGMLQGLTPDGTADFESTAKGASGWWFEQCMKAIDGDSDWTFHFYPWFWASEYALPLDPDERHDFKLSHDAPTNGLSEYDLVHTHNLSLEQIKWRRAKQRELPLTFAQEYPETPLQAFILSGASVFGDVTPALYTPDEPLAPIEGHRYVAGVDWGQTGDYTVISIIDATDDKEVYLARFKDLLWDDMRWRITNACIEWDVETIQPEKNSMGSPNIESLRDNFDSKGFDINVRPITTTNHKKAKWVQNLYKAIHEEGLKLLDPENEKGVKYATYELNAFVQNQTPTGEYKYEAGDGAHDDTVIARLLAWDAVNKLIG